MRLSISASISEAPALVPRFRYRLWLAGTRLRQRSEKDYLQGNWIGSRLALDTRDADCNAIDRRAVARLAAAAAPKSACAGLRGRYLGAAFELYRDRQIPAEPRYGAAPCRTARSAIARAQPFVARGRVRPGLSGAAAAGPGARRGARGHRPRARGTRAIPGAGGRSSLDNRGGQRRVLTPAHRDRAHPIAFTRQRAAYRASPGRTCAAHLKFRRMASASVGAPPAADRSHGRPGIGGAL